jgi:iron complex transport system substrate-binding protein
MPRAVETRSGAGKTTVTLGLMAALKRRGLIGQPGRTTPLSGDWFGDASMTRTFGLTAAILTWLVFTVSAVGAPRRGVTDGVGRRVELPERPHRVVALTPTLTEMMYSLDAGADLVGVTDYAEYPPEAHTRPSVGGIVDPSIERIVALHPDLVFAEFRANRAITVDALQRLGIPVFLIRVEGLDGILQAVQQVGTALNRTPVARALVDRLRARREEVTRRVRGLPKPRVFVLIWPDPVVTVGQHAFIAEAVEAAGAICVTSNIPQLWPRLSLEEVVRLAPETLLLIKGGHGTLAIDEMKTRPGWDRVPAVVASRFVEVDARFEHSSPVVFDALEELARLLHPQAFQKP